MNKVKLGDVMDVKRGTSLSGDHYSTSGDLVRLTLGNFKYPDCGFKLNTAKKDIYFVGEVKPEYIMKKGDIITPLTEQVKGLLGNTATIPESDKYIQSGDVGKIIPNESMIDKRFSYYLVASPTVKKQLSAGSQQTKIRHTSPDKIKDCVAFIPDLFQQKKIAHLLDTINLLIQTNNSAIKQLESMAKTIYDYWFLQFDFPDENGNPYRASGGKMVWNDELKREIPKGWKAVQLGCFADLYQPKTITEKDLNSNGKYFVYGANGIIGKYDKFNHQDKEIAICCRGANCGNYVMTIPNSWITGNSMVVSTKNKEFIYYSLSKNVICNYITGSAQPQITRTNLESAKFLIPNSEILNEFERVATTLRSEMETIFYQNQELASLRDFLLPMLMNGQVTFKEKA